VALSVFGLFAISPTLSTITGLQRQLQDDTQVNEQLQTKIKNLSALQIAYVSIEPDLPMITAAIPVTPRIPFLIGQIQQIATTTNVRITNLQIYQTALDAKTPKDTYVTFAFTISVSGTTATVNQFLKTLSSFDRIITYDTVTIQNQDSTKPAALDIKGNAFFKN
jgi:Tfp pilus assembly protein PilO